MKAGKIVRKLMGMRGYTYQALADKLGRKGASAISNIVFRENGMRVSSLLEMLNAMDCELVIHSKLKDKNEWVVEQGNDEE